jgi:hypothetical protein
MSSETKENYYDDVSQGEIATKEGRGAVFRRKYDFWPSFYQHSLRPKEVIESLRLLLPFKNRIMNDRQEDSVICSCQPYLLLVVCTYSNLL